MLSQKVFVGENRFGKCLIAKENISIGEYISEFDGEIYTANKCTDLPKDVADHAIQFDQNKWKDSTFARFINHSCEPNTAIKDLFRLIAIKEIKEGEELTWDYDMTEDSDWTMSCLCGTKSCRKTIGAFGNLSESEKQARRDHVSDWLKNKYNIK